MTSNLSTLAALRPRTDLGIEGYHDEGDRFPLKGITVKAKGGYTGEKSTTYGKNVVLKGMLE